MMAEEAETTFKYLLAILFLRLQSVHFKGPSIDWKAYLFIHF